MDFKYAEEYRHKISFADNAVKIVASGNSIRYAFGPFHNSELDLALAKRKNELKNVKIFPDSTSFWHYDVHQVDPLETHFYFQNDSYIGRTWESKSIPKRGYKLIPGFIFMTIVSPMDKNGYFWFPFGTSEKKYLWEIKHAQYVIVEVNENISDRDSGWGSVHINSINYVVPSCNALPINVDYISKISPYIERSHRLLVNPGNTTWLCEH